MDYAGDRVHEDHHLLHETLGGVGEPPYITESENRVGSLSGNHLVEVLVRVVKELGDYLAAGLAEAENQKLRDLLNSLFYYVSLVVLNMVPVIVPLLFDLHGVQGDLPDPLEHSLQRSQN